MVNRVADKENAKSILKHNGNQAAMIGMEILYMIISTLTVTTMMAAFSAAAVSIYGTTLISFVVSFIGDLSRASRWGYYSPSMLFSPFKLILMALLFVLLVAATGIVTEMLKAPFEVARYRYYLYLRKNGTRTSASSIFESFDFFVQFAIVTGTREIVIQWLPIVIAVATVILTFVFLLSGVIWFAALILMVGMIAAAVISIYRRLQLWPMAWVQADHPQLSAQQVIARCKEMTAGHIGDLLIFELSYLGWWLLNDVTGGIAGLLYVTPYYNMTKALVYEELKGRAIALDGIQSSIVVGSGLTIAIKPEDIAEKINNLGNKIEQDKKLRQSAAPKYAPALLGISGMYAGSNFPLTPDQPVILGRDSAMAQIVFSQGAQKISRRHCEVMFNSQTQQYRVTDFSSNGTYVNGSRLPANSPVKLARGTEISLGDSNNIMKLL